MEHLLIICTNRCIKRNAGNEKGIPYGMEGGFGMRETALLWCCKCWRAVPTQHKCPPQRGLMSVLRNLGPWNGQQGSSFFLVLLWTSLGFSTNPNTHFVTP